MGWGDELMAAGEAAAFESKIAIFDASQNQRWHEAWEHNPKIARIGESYGGRLYNAPGIRPYVARVNSKAWEWKHYKPKPADLYLSRVEKAIRDKYDSGFVVVEPNLKQKAESINRQWSWERFEQVTRAIDVDWVQLGAIQPRMLTRARWIQTPSARHMAIALSKARAYLGHEGGLHHTAAMVDVPAVVIFGGFISPLVTGYDDHVNLFYGDDLGCGKRIQCDHCKKAMHKIETDQVIEALSGVLR